MEFFQAPPELANQYHDDRILKSYLKRVLPSEMLAAIEGDLARLGERVVTDILQMAQEAEAQEPVHIPYDAWGRRIDEIRTARAWQDLDRVAAEEGIVAHGYLRQYGELSRLYQFAKLYLFHPSSAIYSCPLAMTDGAARLIELHGSEEMKQRAFKHLTSLDPKLFWTSGQWMTERAGGSDVSGSTTIACPDDGQWRIYGEKWFTSATTSQMAMTLARIEGDDKLSLFYLELRNEQGELQNIQVKRLKDKLGTRALPTAELNLTGTPATLVGERGKGVKTIATLFNITRVYNACCAVGYMRRGLALAKNYATKRKAFGKLLKDHGLHTETLAQLQVRFEASFHLTFHAVKLLGKEECGTASEIESQTLRLLIPLAKLFTGKETSAVCNEVMESFGGSGYVEDTGLPQLVRNAQVLSIWEGTTNVLSLDCLRAIKKDNAGSAFLQDTVLRLKGIIHSSLAEEKKHILSAIEELKQTLSEAAPADEENLTSSARSLAMGLARTYSAALMLEQAQWEMTSGESLTKIAVRRWIKMGLYEKELLSYQHRSDSTQLLYQK